MGVELDQRVVQDRLTSFCAPFLWCFSEDTWQKVKGSFQCKKIGEVKLKNKTNPVPMYEVLD